MQRRLDGTDAAMAVLVVVWGTAFVSVKELGTVLDPFELTWFRYVPFLAFFAVWLVVARRDRFRTVSGGDWIRFAACGFFGVLGYHLPLNWSTTTLTPGEPISGGTAAVLVATTPLWTILWVRLLTTERFTPRQLWGSAMAFAGVAMVVFLGHPGATGPTLQMKAIIGLGAPMLWSFYNILAKPLVHRYGGLFTTGVAMGLGTLTLLPFGIARGTAPLVGFTAMDWFWLLYLALLATVAGYMVWNVALKFRSPAQLTSYIYAIPVVATLAGVLLIGERITPWFVAGAALVLYGLTRVQAPARSSIAVAGEPVALAGSSAPGKAGGDATGDAGGDLAARRKL